MFADSGTLGSFTGPSSFTVTNSLRFRANESTYLSRTPTSSGSGTTMTFSMWVKRGGISSLQYLYHSYASSTADDGIRFNSDDTMMIVFGQSWSTYYLLSTTAVFRDVSAWYHLQLVIDTTNAISSERIRLYVNGARTTLTGSMPPQNAASNGINASGIPKRIGAHLTNAYYFDGHIAEFNFVNGLALDPSYFGEINTSTGMWVPKLYSGAYSTNGFRLNFINGTSTTTLGYDVSGNVNNWTPTNISLTGVTYDWMLDTPTNNYSVLNTLMLSTSSTTTQANLTSSCTSGTGTTPASTIAVTSGKFYWEVAATQTSAQGLVGILMADKPATTYYASNPGGVYYNGFDGYKYVNGTSSVYGTSWPTSGVTYIIGVALNLDSGTVQFYLNNVDQGTISLPVSTAGWLAHALHGSSAGSSNFDFNFGQRPFTYTPPSGFTAISTANLAAPTVVNPVTNFTTYTYSGNGGGLQVGEVQKQLDPYTVTNSLRFRSSATAYLNRTPSVAGNRKIWTWSAWIKRGSLSSVQMFFTANANSASDNDHTDIRFSAGNAIQFVNDGSGSINTNLVTTQIFNDPSNWYHVVIAVDTTQATTTNRAKIYVDGSEVTSFSTSVYPPQDASLNINNNINHRIGGYQPGAYWFDGYLSEVNFVDGQALTPTSFGQTDGNGYWVPKAYTGTYGTNGFYLPFINTLSEDPYYNNVSLLLHFDGINTSTSFIDNSYSPKTITATGNTQISTTQWKFGGSSAYFDGTGDMLTCTASDFVWNADFTYECWVYPNDVGYAELLKIGVESSGRYLFFLLSGNIKTNLYGSPSQPVYGTVSAGVWTHIALVRSGSTISVYINGIVSGVTDTQSGTLGNTGFISIGNYLNGYMDDVRITKGIARYTGNFTPPTQAFPNGTTINDLTSDTSGNLNNWTANNISLAPDTTFDSMTDVPSNSYSVLNPLITPPSGFTNSPVNANLGYSGSARYAIGNTSMQTGKWYWEIFISVAGSQDVELGIQSNLSATINSTGGYGWGVKLGRKWVNGTNTTGFGTLTINSETARFAFDADNRTLDIYKNTTLVMSITGIPAGVYYPVMNEAGASASCVVDINFGQRPFSYTPPTGFVALNENNISEVTTDLEQPDFVWIKNRSGTTNHALFDRLRGVTRYISSNTTTVETTDVNSLTEFNKNGFYIGSSAVVNTANNNYVAWVWKAGGIGVSNTAGTIASTVSANTSAGLSIVSWTGSVSTSNQTVGHGLSTTPTFIILRNRNLVDNTFVYHASSTTTTQYLFLTTNAIKQTSGNTVWGSGMTSSVVGVRPSSFCALTTDTVIMYCFTDVPGFSNFGSYTGNGAAIGAFVYCGFKPRFVMIKRTDVANDWYIYDTTRNQRNLTTQCLFPDLSNAEATGSTGVIDIVSNGFKLRGTDAGLNAASANYIFAAFAESPFKFSTAR